MKLRAALLLLALLTGKMLFAQNHASHNSAASATTKTVPVHSVTLKWDPAPGATSYNVYRGTVSGGPYTKIGIALSPSFVDTPVSSGAVFYYVVTSVEGKLESGYSKEMKAAIP